MFNLKLVFRSVGRSVVSITSLFQMLLLHLDYSLTFIVTSAAALGGVRTAKQYNTSTKSHVTSVCSGQAAPPKQRYLVSSLNSFISTIFKWPGGAPVSIGYRPIGLGVVSVYHALLQEHETTRTRKCLAYPTWRVLIKQILCCLHSVGGTVCVCGRLSDHFHSHVFSRTALSR